MVIFKSCELQTLDAVDSVLVNYLVSVRFIYKEQNDITTLFGYLLTVHDTGALQNFAVSRDLVS